MSAHRLPGSKTLHGRRGSASRASTSSLSDDEDAITPCPAEAPKPPQVAPEPKSSQASRRRSWRNSQVYFDLPDGSSLSDNTDAATLWRRMLTVQKLFGCYNSARMQAALELGADSGFVPSKTCLDLMNDSLSQLPDEERKQVEDYLEQENVARRTSFWVRHGVSA